MPPLLTDDEIAVIRAERKPVTPRQRSVLLKPKRHSRHRDKVAKVRVKGEEGRLYELRVRQNPRRPLDFSVIVSHRRQILFRCNGHHLGIHPNRLEIVAGSGTTHVPARSFHVHYLTERYQRFGKPDGYAEPTVEFWSFESAVAFACDSFGFFDPTSPWGTATPLFPTPR
jgi:hypothetical protein